MNKRELLAKRLRELADVVEENYHVKESQVEEDVEEIAMGVRVGPQHQVIKAESPNGELEIRYPITEVNREDGEVF